MDNSLTASEFQAMTGLSAKALRLYSEREVVTPAFIEKRSGYRYYARTQFQHGSLVDLLRRARVPVSELPSFDRWRETVAFNRQLEDFYLQVAEKVAEFDATQYAAHSTRAEKLHWIGVVIDVKVPENSEGKVHAFTEMASDAPAIAYAFNDALGGMNIDTLPLSWSAVPETGGRNRSGQMVLARAVLSLPGKSGLSHIAAQVLADTGLKVAVVSGTLPRRLEVSFSAINRGASTPVDEAAAGYLHVLAFQDHIARLRLAPIRHSARQVSHGVSLFGDGPEPSDLVSVFDVRFPAPTPERVHSDVSCVSPPPR
jgi:DNA-binding transcriptional MerR regulator